MVKKGGRWGYTKEQGLKSKAYLAKINQDEQNWIWKKINEAQEKQNNSKERHSFRSDKD